MRKAIASALMISLALVSGCAPGERTEQTLNTLLEEVRTADAVYATVELRADYGETTDCYTLYVRADREQTELEILAPECIAGIRAVASGDGTDLCYEDVILGVGPLNSEGLTPVSAVPAIFRALRMGYTEAVWTEGDYAAARLYLSEETSLVLWFDENGPLHAEISGEERTMLYCDFTYWEIL